MTTMNMMFQERELVEETADRWWLFLLTGIGWLIFSLLVFQWDYTTVYAISFLFGAVALFAGVNEFFQITVSTTGWKIVHGILGVLFVIAAAWAFVHPHNAFATISALIGFFFLFKGIFDVTAAFATKPVFELWWIQLIVGVIEILLAFWVAGSFKDKTILLVAYVGNHGAVARDHGAHLRVQAQRLEATGRLARERFAIHHGGLREQDGARRRSGARGRAHRRAAVGSACSLIIFLLVGIAAYKLRSETGSAAPIVLLGIAATITVLVFFGIDTLRNAPETFSAIIGIALLAVILDLVWKRVRTTPPVPAPQTPSA